MCTMELVFFCESLLERNMQINRENAGEQCLICIIHVSALRFNTIVMVLSFSTFTSPFLDRETAIDNAQKSKGDFS